MFSVLLGTQRLVALSWLSEGPHDFSDIYSTEGHGHLHRKESQTSIFIAGYKDPTLYVKRSSSSPCPSLEATEHKVQNSQLEAKDMFQNCEG